MSSDAIEEFGKQLVHNVRDSAIPQCRIVTKLDVDGAGVERLRAAAAAAGGQIPAEIMIPECVDRTVFYMFYSMDDADLLHLLFTTPRGETVDVSVVGGGEPAGWCSGANGWYAWYSKERIVDANDYADIAVKWGVQDIPDDPAPNLDELEMPRRAIEELGILFVRHVRDVAIQSCDMQLLPHSQTAVAKRWRRAAIPFNGQVPPQVLISDCVDEAIYAFLRAIDQGLLPLSYVSENGETVDLVKEGRGELAARYMAADGWRAKYSKERVNEDGAE